MEQANILWADDEIDLLKPHILFLKEKGYEVATATNGDDALSLVQQAAFDIVFLDENMPGISGLETLSRMKEMYPSLPIVMITKSEEESIMEEAIGSKISDYLIKPVNPKQILLSLKKNLENKRLISEKATSGYQQEFRQISMRLSDNLDKDDWTDLYKKLIYWELELGGGADDSMAEILAVQKSEANSQFFRFVENNYLDWLNLQSHDAPLMSHHAFKDRVVPQLNEGPVYLFMIDNLRYDQWKVIQPFVTEYFRIEEEELYYSILPTATQYSRNAFFAGLMPSEIERRFPQMWKNDEEEGGKNMHEEDFLRAQLKRLGKDTKCSYHKITNLQKGKQLAENFANLSNNELNVIVYNFVDMLSHARTDMEVIRELADDEEAYRSLTVSWFRNSPLMEMLRKVAEQGAKIIITTDHGTVHVKEPSRMVGDRNTNTNLRYKQGKNMQYDPKKCFVVHDPKEAFLPQVNISQKFLFAKDNYFFVYPNNYNYYVKFYQNTFQHGGISMQEMLIPLITLSAR